MPLISWATLACPCHLPWRHPVSPPLAPSQKLLRPTKATSSVRGLATPRRLMARRRLPVATLTARCWPQRHFRRRLRLLLAVKARRRMPRKWRQPQSAALLEAPSPTPHFLPVPFFPFCRLRFPFPRFHPYPFRLLLRTLGTALPHMQRSSRFILFFFVFFAIAILMPFAFASPIPNSVSAIQSNTALFIHFRSTLASSLRCRRTTHSCHNAMADVAASCTWTCTRRARPLTFQSRCSGCCLAW